MLKLHNGSGKRLNRFLKATGSVLDIMPSSEGLSNFKLQDFCITDDRKAMYSDWLAVGNDFNKSFQTEITHLKITKHAAR